MKAKWFPDRPHRDAVRAIVYFEDTHVFFFHWGVTVRKRRSLEFWRHITLYFRSRPVDKGKGGIIYIGTWLTQDGTTERVINSKRYIMMKTLIG